MWHAPEPPHGDGQFAWWGCHPASEWEFEDGRTPSWTVWDISGEFIEAHTGRRANSILVSSVKVYHANVPEEAEDYWAWLQHLPSFTDNSDAIERYQEYAAQHVKEHTKWKRKMDGDRAMSSMMTYAVLILFTVLSLLFSVSSCSFNDPLNPMM